MTVTLTKAQIDAIKVELAQYGLDVRPTPKPRLAKTVAQVLAKSKWYRPPTLASLAKNHKSTAAKISAAGFELLREPNSGYHFPHREH
jgi:hypothetical protein